MREEGGIYWVIFSKTAHHDSCHVKPGSERQRPSFFFFFFTTTQSKVLLVLGLLSSGLVSLSLTPSTTPL